MVVYYFGYNRGQGHCWRGAPRGQRVPTPIDGVYAPRVRVRGEYRPQEAPQGEAQVVLVAGWTILAFWDRSGDERPNSDTVFVAEGHHSFEEMVAAARARFPDVWDRFPFEVKLIVPKLETRL